MPSWRNLRVVSPIGSVGKSAKQIEMSIAVMISSTDFWNRTASKRPSSPRNVSRFSEARLQLELSRCMYSEHGLDAEMRPDSGQVCQSLIVPSYWMPGSAHSHAACAMVRNSFLASTVSMTSPVIRAAQPEVGVRLDRAHELVGDPDGVVRVLVLHRGDVGAAEVHVEPGVAQHPDLGLLLGLGLTNSSMSGWSTSRTTIFAARRVAPPDLMVPALASAPRMNDTGPEAVPPEDSSSFDERMRERLSPAPEPPLKIRPSSRYQLRIDSIVSSTARMKHALTCCGEVVPTLNQTGELKLNTWCSSIQVSSWAKISASASVAK